jgi:hypothetical protein
VVQPSLARTHKHDGYVRGSENLLRGTAQHRSLNPGPSMGPHDHKAGVLRSNLVQDFVSGLTLTNDGTYLHVRASQLASHTLERSCQVLCGLTARSHA